MSPARLRYLQKGQTRRLLLATGASLGSLGLAILLAWLAGVNLSLENQAPPGPVRVRLGSAVASSSPKQPTPPSPAAPQPTPPPPATETPARPQPVSEPVVPATPPAPAASPAAATTHLDRGAENGNSHETSFGGGRDQVGRRFYVPPADYMPLPATLDAELGQRIGGELFQRWYVLDAAVWRRQGRVDYTARPALWQALEKAGYDLRRAEYKVQGNLAPVSLKFAIGQARVGEDPELINLRLVSSSGNAEVDEAVMYAFRTAAYYNATASEIKGTFTYRFD